MSQPGSKSSHRLMLSVTLRGPVSRQDHLFLVHFVFPEANCEEKSPHDISLAVVSLSSNRKSSVAVSLAHWRLEGGMEGSRAAPSAGDAAALLPAPLALWGSWLPPWVYFEKEKQMKGQ